jgi:hypothetical protein
MSLSKTNDLYRDFAAGIYLSETQNPILPPPTHCIRAFRILIHTGKGGGVEPERRLDGQNFTKLGRKTDCISIL